MAVIDALHLSGSTLYRIRSHDEYEQLYKVRIGSPFSELRKGGPNTNWGTGVRYVEAPPSNSCSVIFPAHTTTIYDGGLKRV